MTCMLETEFVYLRNRLAKIVTVTEDNILRRGAHSISAFEQAY